MLFYLKPDNQRAYIAQMLNFHPDKSYWDNELIDRVIDHVAYAANISMHEAITKILTSRR